MKALSLSVSNSLSFKQIYFHARGMEEGQNKSSRQVTVLLGLRGQRPRWAKGTAWGVSWLPPPPLPQVQCCTHSPLGNCGWFCSPL